MIKSLCLKNVNPKAFVDAPPLGASSEVWNCIQEFERGRSYLVEAGSGRGKSSLCSFLYGLRADFVGKNVPTSLSERVGVTIREIDGDNGVKLFEA